MNEKLLKEVELKIEQILSEGIQSENLNYLDKLVDIHKDLKNEEYWEKKKEVIDMNYREYRRREVPGTLYGRRGIPGYGKGRYREDYVMDEMMEHYGNYNEANEEMNRGNYGAEGEMVKSVEGIMKNIYEIVEELSETEVPEVEHIIKRYAKKISEM